MFLGVGECAHLHLFNGATQSYVVAPGVAVRSGSVLGIWARGIGGLNEYLTCLSDWFPVVMRG